MDRSWKRAAPWIGGAVVALSLAGGLRSAVEPARAGSAPPAPGLQKPDGHPAPSPAGPEVLLRIFATGDSRGFVEPCGCSRGQFGGVSRRATVLDAGRRDGDLAIDLGNLASGTGPQDLLRFRTMWEALEQLQYDVFTPGPRDLELIEDLRALAGESGGPAVLCANLRGTDSSESIFPPWSLFETGRGGRTLVLGLVGIHVPASPGYRVVDPEAVLEELLPRAWKLADRVVVAGFLDGTTCLRIARRWPRLAAVFGGDAPRGTAQPISRGGAPVVMAAELAQYLSWIDLRNSGFGGGRTWLDDSIAGKPLIDLLVERHQGRSRALGAVLARDSVEIFRRSGRAGSAACASCHVEEHASWVESRHSSAMGTLEREGEASNAECLPCHLQDVSPGTQSGRLVDLGVGCESCHGPGAAHVRSRVLDPDTAVHPRMSAGVEACSGCHDKQHSSTFEFTEFWKRIRHGTREAGGVK